MVGRNFVVVTGGNRGIGLEICKQLLTQDRNVIMTSRDVKSGEEAAKKLISQTGSKGDCKVLQLDVSDQDSVQNFGRNIKDSFDKDIHILVNNAGILGPDWSQELYDRTVKINMGGPAKVVEQVLPSMIDGGRIINVSSGLGSLVVQSEYYRQAITAANSVKDLLQIPFVQDDEQKSKFSPTYNVSKAMLNRYTQLLSNDPEVRSKGISVNAVCPGWVRTDMGGSNATRSPEEGVASIWYLIDHKDPSPNGGFFRDGQPLEW
eukprot:TRINITY_DN10807_c0_g1_i6.p1 TRINITY_DN10807_c0_g1~~TRINITY_DN10807_c0_g1_i6.p1  ORF type:complete len:273 (-),score=18.74 TRINITY_DN10807_c0_g1_i6:367-1152(-)